MIGLTPVRALLLVCTLLTLGVSESAVAGNATPYYLADGDSSRMVEILDGSVVNNFSTFNLGYAIAINQQSIWLGQRDNQGAIQYNLDGSATGATSPGGDYLSQLLDGTSDGTHNYGVTCCNGANYVTIANQDWSGQRALFSIPTDASGITYDALSGNLWITFYDGTLRSYDLQGNQLSMFYETGFLAGLAYEGATDTLWAWNRYLGALEQIDKTTGHLLEIDSIDLSAYGVFNPFGAEMTAGSLPAHVPEPGALALWTLGLLSLFCLRRRRPA